MAVVHITAKQLPAALKRKNVGILQAIGRGALAGAHRGRAFIVRKTPVDQGQLKATWKVFPGDRGLLQGKPSGRRNIRAAELRNTAPHAGIVELGARPHKVSRAGWLAIYDWVVRHRVELGLVTKGGKARRVKKGADGKGLDPEIAGITWAIVRKIGIKGQKPTYFVRENLPTLVKIVEAEVERALELEARGRGKGGK